MIENTPYWVSQWLRAHLEVVPQDDPDWSILSRLEQDEQMASLWDKNLAGSWPGWVQSMLLEDVVYFARPKVLESLLKPIGKQRQLAQAQSEIWNGAETLLQALKAHPAYAIRFLDDETRDLLTIPDPAPRDEFVEKLLRLYQRARTEAESVRRVLDHLEPPSRRGPGDTMQIAYRRALGHALGQLPDIKLSQSKQDEIVALLSGVVFGCEIEADAVQRDRDRRRATRSQDKSREH